VSKARSERYHIVKAVGYYRERKEAGHPWVPKPSSKLHAYCLAHGLDPKKVVLGEQDILP
jgi:hypothetical protein